MGGAADRRRNGSEEIDQWDLLFQQVRRLERIAREAENSGQFSAAVGALTALNRMMALGADEKGFSGHRRSRHCFRRCELTSAWNVPAGIPQ